MHSDNNMTINSPLNSAKSILINPMLSEEKCILFYIQESISEFNK